MNTLITSIVAKNLKVLRKNKGLSEEEVAEHLQISQSTYSRMERGKCNSWALHIDSISNLYNISFEDLVKVKKIKNNNLNHSIEDLDSITKKLIAQLEARIDEKDAIINELKSKLNKLK